MLRGNSIRTCCAGGCHEVKRGREARNDLSGDGLYVSSCNWSDRLASIRNTINKLILEKTKRVEPISIRQLRSVPMTMICAQPHLRICFPIDDVRLTGTLSNIFALVFTHRRLHMCVCMCYSCPPQTDINLNQKPKYPAQPNADITQVYILYTDFTCCVCVYVMRLVGVFANVCSIVCCSMYKLRVIRFPQRADNFPTEDGNSETARKMNPKVGEIQTSDINMHNNPACQLRIHVIAVIPYTMVNRIDVLCHFAHNGNRTSFAVFIHGGWLAQFSLVMQGKRNQRTQRRIFKLMD